MTLNKMLIVYFLALIVAAGIAYKLFVIDKVNNSSKAVMYYTNPNLLGKSNPETTLSGKEGQPAFKVYAEVNKDGNQVIDLFLGEEIVGPEAYVYLADALTTLTEKDVVNVHLYGYGGSVQGGTVILNGLEQTKARVIMRVEAPIYSMHAVIACVGDEIVMSEGTYLMFHDASMAAQGKISEINAYVDEAKISLAALLQNGVDRKILTKEQVADILSGRDVYVSEKYIKKHVDK